MSVSFFRALSLLTLLACLTACGGGGSGTPPPSPPPSNLQYLVDPAFYRVGTAITPNTATTQGGAPTTFGVSPALPAGLSLDTSTGTIAGTPTATASQTAHTVTATNAAGQTTTDVLVTVGAALPSALESLAEGFDAEVVVEPGLPSPAKIAKFARAAIDGRIFYLETDTGNVRVWVPGSGAGTGLLPTPFATIQVLQGGHMGLLGLTLAPDFATSGHVYVLACVPGDAMAMTQDRIQVIRFTDVANVGTNRTVVIDDLPVAPPGGINNGGEILFDGAGMLLVSLGDIQDPNNSQAATSTSLAGKVLRYDVSGGTAAIPNDNPFSSDPEWCRGLRNTFGLAVHPTTGGVFGVDNGPAADDELNFLQPGKNFAWGGNPPAPDLGFKIRNWGTVIVPTAICWHDGTGWGADFANDLFVAAYDEHTLTRFEMSGTAFTDIDRESEFCRFVLSGSSNHPLDVCVASDGSIYVSTFTGIYRITQTP